ncbi:MAG: hypothetical protein ACI9N9_000593 [Enterobacterales bacterium]|jgi:hypothetical protein
MNQLVKFIILMLVITFSTSCYSKTVIIEDVKDLNIVKQHLNANKENKNDILVIFDIDDTLLDAVNFVGSNKWYDWQRGREVLDTKGNTITVQKQDIYYCMFSTLGTLFDLGTSKLTQPDTAQIINDIDSHDLMLLTARTYNFRRATERELNINGLDFTAKHLLKNQQSLDFSLNDKNRTDRVTYQNGLVMSSGLNKGMVLKEILSKVNKTYKTIYFIDDSRKNITNMTKEWKDSATSFYIFHYTKTDKSISKEEIAQSNQSKQLFDGFLKTAYPDRSEAFVNSTCR